MDRDASPLAPGLGGEDYRAHVRAWLAANVPDGFLADRPGYRVPDLAACKAWEAAMHRGGLAGITWPKAYGGHGMTLREHLIANQEIGRLALPESVNSLGKELAGPTILAIGTEAQKARYLPPLLQMREIWCQGFSEPNAGSDLAGLRTRATKDGAAWRISASALPAPLSQRTRRERAATPWWDGLHLGGGNSSPPPPCPGLGSAGRRGRPARPPRPGLADRQRLRRRR